ncbi:MAG: GAF domain-containing protein [Elusimicrobia bacterium]|nr:GAF domain-containing protein [Elusimicrobiota bacterium]
MSGSVENETRTAACSNDTATALELFSIAGSLSSTLDLDYLLEKIGLAAERLLDSEASSIMLVTDDKKSLFFKVAGGEAGAKLKKMTLPVGKGIAGWVAEHRKPEVVVDTRKDPRFAGQFDKASGFVTRSLLAVPMVFRGELVGVAEVLNKRRGQYTPEDVTLLASLANLASIAITNARIMQDQKNFFSHVLELLIVAIESSRPGLLGHPHRSARLACALARALGADEYEYRMIYYAGLLHDIGFIAFRNPRALADLSISTPTDEQHPLLSAKLLEGIKMLEGALPVIRHHHEAYDVTGYPGKLKGGAIPRGARIIAVVEALEDLRMAGLDAQELLDRAAKEIAAGRGARFDPEISDAAVELLSSPGGMW